MRQPLTPVPYAKRTEPSVHCYQGHAYVPEAHSDIRNRFAAVLAAQKAKEDPELVEKLSASVAVFKQRKVKT